MVQIFNEFFCERKSTFFFSIERIGEVFRYCVFCDTIQSIEGADLIKKGFWLRQTGFKMQVQKKRSSVIHLKQKRGHIVIYFFWRHGRAVRRRTANPFFPGSNLGVAWSTKDLKSLFLI